MCHKTYCKSIGKKYEFISFFTTNADLYFFLFFGAEMRIHIDEDIANSV